MPKAEGKLDRETPRRFMDKKGGLRHLIHAAIRMIFEGEDPFAINVIAQSAEKVELDLLRRTGRDDPVGINKLVPEAQRSPFIKVYRETYNFLKHADKDHDQSLPIHDMVAFNDIVVLGTVVRYQALFSELTLHMRAFAAFSAVCHPYLNWESVAAFAALLKMEQERNEITRGELLDSMNQRFISDFKFMRERQDDLRDVRTSNKCGLEN